MDAPAADLRFSRLCLIAAFTLTLVWGALYARFGQSALCDEPGHLGVIIHLAEKKPGWPENLTTPPGYHLRRARPRRRPTLPDRRRASRPRSSAFSLSPPSPVRGAPFHARPAGPATLLFALLPIFQPFTGLAYNDVPALALLPLRRLGPARRPSPHGRARPRPRLPRPPDQPRLGSVFHPLGNPPRSRSARPPALASRPRRRLHPHRRLPRRPRRRRRDHPLRRPPHARHRQRQRLPAPTPPLSPLPPSCASPSACPSGSPTCAPRSPASPPPPAAAPPSPPSGSPVSPPPSHSSPPPTPIPTSGTATSGGTACASPYSATGRSFIEKFAALRVALGPCRGLRRARLDPPLPRLPNTAARSPSASSSAPLSSAATSLFDPRYYLTPAAFLLLFIAPSRRDFFLLAGWWAFIALLHNPVILTGYSLW